jgi:hypothetical protein
MKSTPTVVVVLDIAGSNLFCVNPSVDIAVAILFRTFLWTRGARPQKCPRPNRSGGCYTVHSQYLQFNRQNTNCTSRTDDVNAVHIAAATVHGVDYLLTWNCKKDISRCST